MWKYKSQVVCNMTFPEIQAVSESQTHAHCTILLLVAVYKATVKHVNLLTAGRSMPVQRFTLRTRQWSQICRHACFSQIADKRPA